MNDHPLFRAIMAEWPDATVVIRPKGQPVNDITTNEIAAIEAASDPAGEYLEKLGKTDLAVLSRDEWLGFLETVISAYAEHMAKAHAPFAVNRSADDPFLTDLERAEQGWNAE